MSSSLVQVRMDTELRDSANTIFDELGIDMSTAIKMFLKKCVAEGGIYQANFSAEVAKRMAPKIIYMAACILMDHPFEKELDIEKFRTEELTQEDLKSDEGNNQFDLYGRQLRRQEVY